LVWGVRGQSVFGVREEAKHRGGNRRLVGKVLGFVQRHHFKKPGHRLLLKYSRSCRGGAGLLDQWRKSSSRAH